MFFLVPRSRFVEIKGEIWARIMYGPYEHNFPSAGKLSVMDFLPKRHFRKKTDAFHIQTSRELIDGICPFPMCTANMRWLMIAMVQFYSNNLQLLFDMLRLLMRYLGSICQITAVMPLI